MAEQPRCRWCGGDHLLSLGHPAPWPHRDPDPWAGLQPGELLRCRRCGFGQRHPHATPAVLQGLYRGASSADMAYAPKANAAWRQALKLLRKEPGPSASTILDVGCHTGAFLAQLPAQWRRFGVESAREPAALAADRHGVRIIAERIDTIEDRWGGCFDVITLFDVFEHLVSPCDDLRRLTTLLRPGGWLILSTGDLDSWPWRLAGTEHWYLQTPLHISFGSRTFFNRLPQDLPFKLVHCKRIPHMHKPLRTRLDEAACLLHWVALRRGGGWRIPQRAIQLVPRWSGFRHRQSPPWTTGLRDHLLVVYRRA